MNYWLLKSEPQSYSWNNLEQDRITTWDGVRNYQARNYISNMQINDLAFFYRSVTLPAIVGVVKIISAPKTDITDQTGKFLSIDVGYQFPLKKELSLAVIKTNNKLQNLLLLKQSRLSVMPIEKASWELIIQLAGM
jgi:predicted RNA-binding protein with PUA-like domain